MGRLAYAPLDLRDSGGVTPGNAAGPDQRPTADGAREADDPGRRVELSHSTLNLKSQYRYCPWDSLEAALCLGWMPSTALHAPHGEYSLLVEWPCDCPPRWPA
jgi:hypothetical protein